MSAQGCHPSQGMQGSEPVPATLVSPRRQRVGGLRVRLVRNKWLYIIMLPGILYFLIFRYLPMWGVVIAFQNFQPFLGFGGGAFRAPSRRSTTTRSS